MKENNKVEATRWFKQAEHDFLVAKNNFQNEFWSDCCFMCQQAVEKLLKSFLFYKGVRPGIREVITHSIGELIKHCQKHDKDFDKIKTAKELDRYYIPTRYPNGLPGGLPFEMYEKKDADEALSLAQEILNIVSVKIK